MKRLLAAQPSPEVRDLLAALVVVERRIEHLVGALGSGVEPEDFEPLSPDDEAAPKLFVAGAAALAALEAASGRPLPADLVWLLAAREAGLLESWLFRLDEIPGKTADARRDGLPSRRIFLGHYPEQRLVFEPDSAKIVEVDARWTRLHRMTVEALLARYLGLLCVHPMNLFHESKPGEAIARGENLSLSLRVC